MPQADGRNLSGDKVKFYYSKATEVLSDAFKGKIKAGTAAAADVAGNNKLVTAANELKGVDEASEYGRETESTTEQPYGNPSFNVLGVSTLADLDVTYMPDLSVDIDLQFAVTDALGTEVVVAEELTGNTSAKKTYNVILGNLGGVRRVANKNGSQRYRRRIIVSAVQMGIAAA